MELCLSIKSKKEPYEQCPRKPNGKSTFCHIHKKQKNIVLFNSEELSPLQSTNDTDIISLEKIYYYENGKPVLAREIKKEYLFTYKINVCGQEFQRTLNILSIKSLIDAKHLIDPFSNVPFTEDIINRAQDMIKRLNIKTPKVSKKEKKSLLINGLITKFQEIGYIIHPEWIIKMKKIDYIKWYNEVVYLWKEFRNDYIDLALSIYPALDLPHFSENSTFELSVMQLFLDLTASSIMGTTIVLSGLAYSNQTIKNYYPDI